MTDTILATSTKPKPAAPPPAAKKDGKKSLKGVLVKKKVKPAPTESNQNAGKSSGTAEARSKPQDDEEPQAKRRKLAGPESR